MEPILNAFEGIVDEDPFEIDPSTLSVESQNMGFIYLFIYLFHFILFHFILYYFFYSTPIFKK